LLSVGEANGSTPTTLMRPAYQAAIPDQPAAAHGHEKRIDIRRLFFEFQPERSLSDDGFVLIERRHRQCAGLPRPCLAGGERIRIAVAFYHQLGAIFANALHLGRRSDAWDEDLCRLPELHRGIGDSRAVIAPRCRDDAGFRHVAGQQIGESAARLERARMLKQFELEREGMRWNAKLGAVDRHDRRSPDMGPNEFLALYDRLLTYGISMRVHCKHSAALGQLTEISHLAN